MPGRSSDEPRALRRTALVVVLAFFIVSACVFPRRAQELPLPDPLAAGWKGKSVCERLHEDEAQRVLRCTFPPGVGHERHFHAAHFGYVLSGGLMRMTDAEGTRDVEVKTGGTWSSPGVAWHEVVNIGETTTSVIVFEPK